MAYYMQYRPHPTPKHKDTSRCGADPGRTIDVDVRPSVGLLRWHWKQSSIEGTRYNGYQNGYKDGWATGWQAGYKVSGSQMGGG